MSLSVKTKLSFGIAFFFLIILVLFVFSSIQISELSKKTDAILTENHLSIVCAREMSESLSRINSNLSTSFIVGKMPDSEFVTENLKQFAGFLHDEKNNVTEVGEDKLVSNVEADFSIYRDSVSAYLKNSECKALMAFLQDKNMKLDQELMLLSKMNEKAVELKTSIAKASSKKAKTQMAVLGTFCFLIALSFTYSFSSYFRERIAQLHQGIKEIVASNYGQRLHFEGKDEFSDIAVVFNEMAENLNKIYLEKVAVPSVQEKKDDSELVELKKALLRIQSVEKEVESLISKYESKTL